MGRFASYHDRALRIIQRFLELSHAAIDHEVMCDRAQDDEDVKDFVASEARIVSPGPFDGVKDAADGIENAAQDHPEEWLSASSLIDHGDCDDADPSQGDIDARGEFSRCVDPEEGEQAAADRERPDERQNDGASGSRKYGQAQGGIGACDEQVDSHVVDLAQEDSAVHCGVD